MSHELESQIELGRAGLRTDQLVVVLDSNHVKGGYRTLRGLPLIGIKPIVYGFMAGAAHNLGGLGDTGASHQVERCLAGDFLVAGRTDFFDERYRDKELARIFPDAKVTPHDRRLIEAMQSGNPNVKEMDNEFPGKVGIPVAKATHGKEDVWREAVVATSQSGGTLRAQSTRVTGLSAEDSLAFTSIHDAANILHVGAELGAEAPLVPMQFLPLFSIARNQSVASGKKTLNAVKQHKSFNDLDVSDQWEFLTHAIDLFERCWYNKRFDVDRFRQSGLQLVSLNLCLGIIERAPRLMTERQRQQWKNGLESAFMQTARRARKYERWAETSVRLLRGPVPMAYSAAQLAITYALKALGVSTPFNSGPSVDEFSYNALSLYLQWCAYNKAAYLAESALGTIAANELNLPLAARHLEYVSHNTLLDNAGDRLPLRS